MQTRIISAFPGTGKSYCYNKYKDKCLDSDSSTFDKKDFPANYIRHIKENIGKYEFIFVSSHDVVREALKANCIFHYLIYPRKDHKDAYIKRYKDRGSAQSLIDLIDYNWDNWIDQCNEIDYPCCEKIEIGIAYLEDVIEHIVDSEGGE